MRGWGRGTGGKGEWVWLEVNTSTSKTATTPLPPVSFLSHMHTSLVGVGYSVYQHLTLSSYHLMCSAGRGDDIRVYSGSQSFDCGEASGRQNSKLTNFGFDTHREQQPLQTFHLGLLGSLILINESATSLSPPPLP